MTVKMNQFICATLGQLPGIGWTFHCTRHIVNNNLERTMSRSRHGPFHLKGKHHCYLWQCCHCGLLLVGCAQCNDYNVRAEAEGIVIERPGNPPLSVETREVSK
jgi:hypothetical protein